MDDLEAGELSVEFEGEEPEAVLEWGIERFGDRLVISTAFQEGDVALIDMAYRIDPKVKVFSIDTGRLPTGDVRAGRDPARALPRPAADAPLPRRDPAAAARRPARAEPLLALGRAAAALLQRAQGATADQHLGGVDAWVTGLRRDQWAGRTDIRKMEIDHDHGAIVKLNPLAEWTQDEVWDYVRENNVPVHPLYAQGYTSIGCAPCTRPIKEGEPKRAGRWWWESGAPKECGMHCAIETGGFEHELHAILGKDAEACDDALASP